MTFELGVVIVVALVAVALALVCYHLLGRLELLERAVHGGLQPPSTRLSREQFERRFRTAHARSSLAREISTGIVIIVGPEHHTGSELASTIAHLPRRDLCTIRHVDRVDAEALGIATTPYLFVIDNHSVRQAKPVAGSQDVVTALQQFA